MLAWHGVESASSGSMTRTARARILAEVDAIGRPEVVARHAPELPQFDLDAIFFQSK